MKTGPFVPSHTNKLTGALHPCSSSSSFCPSPPPLSTLQSFSTIMAALWLQSASLLVLMVMLCPGTQAFGSQHLCGSHLVEALNLVCADRGFFFNPRRDVDSLLNFLPPKSGGAAATGGENEIALKDQMEMMVKRGIVEQCCHRPCSVNELENYCN